MMTMIVSNDTIMTMIPPFTITSKMLALVSEISRLLGQYEGIHTPAPQPQLRRQNRIKTIQGSLAIEGNTLSLDQVTAVFENKRVIGPKKEILEAKNAINLYNQMEKLRSTQLKDLLKAHAILMKDLVQDAGKFRSHSVGVLKNSIVSHIAPPSGMVLKLMEELFQFLNETKESSPLIKSCVFHYELEFIHPFSDGNGRMGRFWQQLILTNYHPIFAFLSIESCIKERQSSYYLALEQSDKNRESSLFIEFSLETIHIALSEFLTAIKPAPITPKSRLEFAQTYFKKTKFSRKEYLSLFKTISTATASRDLNYGVLSGLLAKIGDLSLSRYHFKSLS